MTSIDGLHVGPSGNPDKPLLVTFGHGTPAARSEPLARDEAWRLWHLLQAELLRTMPNPPPYPAQATR